MAGFGGITQASTSSSLRSLDQGREDNLCPLSHHMVWKPLGRLGLTGVRVSQGHSSYRSLGPFSL